MHSIFRRPQQTRHDHLGPLLKMMQAKGYSPGQSRENKQTLWLFSVEKSRHRAACTITLDKPTGRTHVLER